MTLVGFTFKEDGFKLPFQEMHLNRAGQYNQPHPYAWLPLLNSSDRFSQKPLDLEIICDRFFWQSICSCDWILLNFSK